MSLLLGVLALAAIVLVVIALSAIGIAAMQRTSARHPRGGSLGTAMQELESLFVESKKHVIEAERAEADDEDQSGDPPVK